VDRSRISSYLIGGAVFLFNIVVIAAPWPGPYGSLFGFFDS
jgi:hypothetical protein